LLLLRLLVAIRLVVGRCQACGELLVLEIGRFVRIGLLAVCVRL
jgi:hypothetical protein